MSNELGQIAYNIKSGFKHKTQLTNSGLHLVEYYNGWNLCDKDDIALSMNEAIEKYPNEFTRAQIKNSLHLNVNRKLMNL